jgi:hypothetical protein
VGLARLAHPAHRALGLHILALFPFEPELYQEAGVPVTYVGHPLADMIPMEPDRAEARRALRLPLSQPIVALLPGSRKAELHYMADLFVKTAKTLIAEVPDAHFVAPMASRAMLDMFNLALRRHAALDLPLKLMFGHSHEALCAADVALVASGTATLETALFKTPMVITYRQSMLNSILMKRMIYLPYIGLPNILAEEQFVPSTCRTRPRPTRWQSAPRPAHQQGCARSPDRALPQDSRDAQEGHRRHRRRNRLEGTRCRVASPSSAGSTRRAGARWPAPVYAAAVVLDPAHPIRGLKDSKKLLPEVREELREKIFARAKAWYIAYATVAEIDTLNILGASLLAMQRAVAGLGIPARGNVDRWK